MADAPVTVGALNVRLTADASELNRATAGATRRLNETATAAQAAGARISSGFGAKVQQAGYQVGDFAVQVAGGQSALVAFAQQGGQLAGMFGPGGAVVGAMIAVGAAIAGVAMSASNAAPDLEALAKAGQSLADLRLQQMQEFAGAVRDIQDAAALNQIQQLDWQILDLNHSMQMSNVTIERLRKEVQAATEALHTDNWGADDVAAEQRELTRATTALNAALEKQAATTAEINALSKERKGIIEEHTKGTKQTRDAVAEQLKQLQLQVDMVGKTEEEQAKLAFATRFGAEATAAQAAEAERLITTLYRLQEAQKNTVEAMGAWSGEGSIFGGPIGDEAYAEALERQAEQLEGFRAQEAANYEMRKEAAKNYADYAVWVEEQKNKAIATATSGLVSLMNSNSRKLFEVGKAAAIANTIISGIEEVSHAFRWGTNMGGPYLGAAFAAAAAAGVAMRVQQINSTKFGSSGGATSIGSGGTPVVNTQTQTQVASIQIVGNNNATFTRDQVVGLIGAINEAVGDGVKLETR